MAIEPSPWRFTVSDYHHMAEAGILCEDDPVELIDGEIIQMSPIGGKHVACVGILTHLLVQQIGHEARVNIQSSIRLGEFDEPEPDVAVVRARRYGDDLPTSADVLLLIEVADSTLRYDRTVKLPLYAGSGIPEAWIVDLQGEAIERHSNPMDGTYRITMRVGRGEQIESVTIPGLVLRADEVLE